MNAIEPCVTEPRTTQPRAILTTDLDAVRHNLRVLAPVFAPARTMLVVKANAYGHGLLDVARAAESVGVTDFAVLDVETGLALRTHGVEGMLFAWRLTPSTDFAAAVRARIDLGVQSEWQLDRLATLEQPARVHLKLDTGLHRGGVNPDEWDALVTHALELQQAGKLRVIGAWTHFSDNSMAEDEESLRLFENALERARELGAEFEVRHAAATGAGIDFPASRLDYVRLGLGGFGISPFDDRSGRDLGLKPALSLTAPVTRVHESAIEVAVGYGDGLQSAPDASMSLSIAGVPHRILDVGVDVTRVARVPGTEVEAGSLAYCFGDGGHGEATAEQWAKAYSTVPDEIVTGVTARVQRQMIHTAATAATKERDR